MKEIWKKHKKLIVIAVVAVVVVAFFFNPFKGSGNSDLMVQTTVLAKQDLSKTVEVTGLVESADSMKVTSSLAAYEMQTINVKAGDKVEAGQVLGTVDVEDLLLDVQKAEASLNINDQTTGLTLNSTQQEYEDFKADLENNMNSSINNAQTNVDNALTTLNDAKKAYNEALEDMDQGENETIKKAQKAVDNARKAYRDASDTSDSYDLDSLKRELSEALAALATAEANDAPTKALEMQVSALQSQISAASSLKGSSDSAYDAYKEAKDALADAVKAADKQLESYLDAVDKAQTAYDNAEKNLTIAKRNAQQQLKTYEDSLTKTQLSASDPSRQIELQKLKKQLNEAEITAPISGTVTAVNVEVGDKASGVLFVIENADALKINTAIKEYDLMSVQNGMKAIISADAIPNEKYNGKVSFIAPAAKKAADGSTKSGSSSVEFESEIDVTDTKTDLRIGMNAKVNIIVEEKKGALAVPYDAVITDVDGTSYIYVAQQDGNKYTAKKVIVTIGMETDFLLEVISDELQEGDIVITSPQGVSEGATVLLG
ncbi:efflux RND transporter periplasmic adaptor subunit [Dielma fastidiosa]|uniref:Efflux RND transporter periplasmic adaptor subunit n=1 Tax=Dielma fastidiosa TaxID=1034346 RepID=A0AB35UND1_9FIRM|nr:efflux RND transporter periplasmic adaptor subunit [Dielma fastidiosa]MDY5166615.1 efflux RND transporter periplasmic adaptor subunit [Dielma fastidiosa]